MVKSTTKPKYFKTIKLQYNIEAAVEDAIKFDEL
jgi:hypothetical protein